MATTKPATLNLTEIAKCFSDETAARKRIEAMRWPNGPECPLCGLTSTVYRMQKLASSVTPGRPGLLRCRACKKQFTVTTGTVFEASHIPLSKWLHALYLICASKKGMSAHQFHRMLGITYKSAWFMAHRLRYAMMEGPMADLLQGVVEADETYVGAKKKRGTKRGRPGADSHKTPVVALVERGTGRVRATTMPRVTSENLKKMITSNVDADAALMTDDFAPYKNVGHATHLSVNHSAGEYVRADIHTNTVEGFFSLLKRGINGVYHHVGRGHLDRYCDEFAFRYEHRQISDGARAERLVRGAEGKRLTYKQPAAS
jgi:transposase-like protein